MNTYTSIWWMHLLNILHVLVMLLHLCVYFIKLCKKKYKKNTPKLLNHTANQWIPGVLVKTLACTCICRIFTQRKGHVQFAEWFGRYVLKYISRTGAIVF